MHKCKPLAIAAGKTWMLAGIIIIVIITFIVIYLLAELRTSFKRQNESGLLHRITCAGQRRALAAAALHLYDS